jgi:hypothetical protein
MNGKQLYKGRTLMKDETHTINRISRPKRIKTELNKLQFDRHDMSQNSRRH